MIISTKEQLECDHDGLILKTAGYGGHDNPFEFMEVCEICNVRLDGPHGLLHYQEKIKYNEDLKENGS